MDAQKNPQDLRCTHFSGRGNSSPEERKGEDKRGTTSVTGEAEGVTQRRDRSGGESRIGEEYERAERPQVRISIHENLELLNRRTASALSQHGRKDGMAWHGNDDGDDKFGMMTNGA